MRKRLARFKIYTERARWYMIYVQMLLLIGIWLNTLGIDLVWWHYPIILIICACLFIVFGYLEVKIGLLKYEQEKYAQENPVLQDILKEIKELKNAR